MSLSIILRLLFGSCCRKISRRHVYFDIELAFYYEFTRCHILCIQIDHMFRSCWSMKKVLFFAARRESDEGKLPKRASYSPKHETAGSFTKNWRYSNQLTGLSFPRTKRGRACPQSRLFSDSVLLFALRNRSTTICFRTPFHRGTTFQNSRWNHFLLAGRNVWLSIIRNRVKWYISTL